MSAATPVILLAEDDDNDVFFMRRALKKAEIHCPLHIVHDGQEALDYLQGAGKFSDRVQHPLPTLIFLDIKLPYLGGLEVLAWIRSHPQFQALPVFVLTSSAEERDRQRTGELGVQGYYVKPPTPEMVRSAIRTILPPERAPG